MRKIITSLFIFFTFSTFVQGQTISNSFAENFIDLLVNNPEEISNHIFFEDLQTSERLGISYENVPLKFLISYGLTSNEQLLIKQKKLVYSYEIQPIDQRVSKLTLELNDAQNTSKSFYFLFGKWLISPLEYFTQNWNVTESKYFKFLAENPDLINNYSILRLDKFVDETSKILGIDEYKLKRLEQNKIIYAFAESEQSIKILTGYSSRGQYNLALDAIITTYNAHFHELAHLLLNYKLQNLNLYTHPFLQEGLAVALGGRGGLAKEALFSFAEFAIESEFIDPAELFDPTSFLNNDPSISYSASGLLIHNFLEDNGIDELLKLFKAHSGENYNEIDPIPQQIFSPGKTFTPIEILHNEFSFEKLRQISKESSNSVFEDDKWYYFSISDTLILNSLTDEISKSYISTKFQEVFPKQTYTGFQYLLVANSNEIAIYDLFINELIANYVVGFQTNPKATQTENGAFIFRITKEVFFSPLSDFNTN